MPEIAAISFAGISAVFQRQVKGLRKPVSSLAKEFGHARAHAKELAPKVIGLFNKLKGEYAALSFVDFARMFDPAMASHGPDKDGAIGYRNNRTYAALDYMRRLTNLRPKGRQGVRDSATDALARSIATILQVVPDPEPVWNAVAQEFGFQDRIMTRLRKRVEATQPLFALEARQVKVGAVVHMAPAVPAQQAPNVADINKSRGRRRAAA